MSLHFYTFPVHFFHPPFFGLNNWFRAKTTWGTHPTGFLSSKKWILGCFNFFSKKSWFFRAKMKFFFSLKLFVPKPPETNFRHNLHIFLLYKPIKTGKKGQNDQFLGYLVIFGHFCSRQNIGGIFVPKCRFDTWIWKLDVWSMSGYPRFIWDRVWHTPKKMRSKIKFFF